MKMKKLLGIVVLVLLMCNKSYAELQIFTISCEGTIKSRPGPDREETYYEDLQIYVGNGKEISTIEILPSHPGLRSGTYIIERANDPEVTGWGNLIIFNYKQSIITMESAKNTSVSGKLKLLHSKFRLSLVNDTLMGATEMEITTDSDQTYILRSNVKSKCIGTEKIKKYLKIN